MEYYCIVPGCDYSVNKGTTYLNALRLTVRWLAVRSVGASTQREQPP